MREILSYSYGCVMAVLPDELAKRIMDFGKSIADADIYDDEDGEKGREDMPHVTVKYGLHTDNPDAVKAILNGHAPAKIKLGKMSAFHNDDFVVLKIEVDSPDLHALNKDISDSLACTDGFPEYNPHVTIAYLNHRDDDEKWYESLFSDMFAGEEFEVERLRFSTPAEDEHWIGLEGSAEMAKAAGRIAIAQNVYNRFRFSSGLSSFSNKWEAQGLSVFIYESKYGDIVLSQVVVPKEKRGEGIGTEFMEELISLADRTGKRITLTPDTTYGGSSVSRLRNFYKRFGFVDNKGRNKDYTTGELMYRRPRGEKVASPDVDPTRPGSVNDWRITYDTGSQKWTDDRPGDGIGASSPQMLEKYLKEPAIQRGLTAIQDAIQGSGDVERAVDGLVRDIGTQKATAVIGAVVRASTGEVKQAWEAAKQFIED